MHPHLLGLTLRAPLPARVIEIADKLLLLGINRDHRLARNQGGTHAFVEMMKLRIAIGVTVPLAGLLIGLQ